jgi:hypothetical protein
MNKLSISFANIKNIKTNYLFAQKLIRENQIVFLSETWLSELDKDFLVDISTESKVFSKSDLQSIQEVDLLEELVGLYIKILQYYIKNL